MHQAGIYHIHIYILLYSYLAGASRAVSYLYLFEFIQNSNFRIIFLASTIRDEQTWVGNYVAGIVYLKVLTPQTTPYGVSA
jgi:hypothetical protein